MRWRNPISSANKRYYVYILQCSDGTFYTGFTTDLPRRLNQHNQGFGARYTRSRRPVHLIYQESHRTQGEALKREYWIKQLTRKDKQVLILEGDGG